MYYVLQLAPLESLLSQSHLFQSHFLLIRILLVYNEKRVYILRCLFL